MSVAVDGGDANDISCWPSISPDTGGHTRLQLTHAGAPTLAETRSPAISSDGRFVTFVGTELTPDGIEDAEVGVERQTQAGRSSRLLDRATRWSSVTNVRRHHLRRLPAVQEHAASRCRGLLRAAL